MIAAPKARGVPDGITDFSGSYCFAGSRKKKKTDIILFDKFKANTFSV
jgi:hypothetical protein